MFPAAAVCPTALSGTRWDGSRAPSWVPVTAVCVGKGAASSGDTKGGVARAPEAFGLVFCSCKDSVGSERQ